MLTKLPNGWRVPRSEQRYYINYIVHSHKDYEVIGISKVRFLDPEQKKTEFEYRIYMDGLLDMQFTSQYFQLYLFQSLDETMEDLKEALVRVKEDKKEGSEYENAIKYNILCRLARKYHQGWSWFFSEKEYVENIYEEYADEDEGAIITKLDKLHTNFRLEVHFNLVVQDEDVDWSRKKYLDSSNSKKKKKFTVEGKNLTETGLAMINPKNEFMTTRYTITTIIAGESECSLCKKLIRDNVDGQVNLPYTHRFHRDCPFVHMTEIETCPVCHIYIHLSADGKILNPCSNNYPSADESLMRYIRNLMERVLPHAPQRTVRQIAVLGNTRLNKDKFVQAFDSFIIYPREQFLYYWLETPNLPACAVNPTL
jgi:hypothetical protein